MAEFRFELLETVGAARRGRLHTAHGAAETPAFMPVGTAGTVKGMLPEHVGQTGAEIVLGNTYHLMLRPGASRVKALGGLHRFMDWPGPILTDSGGFQVMSLGSLRTLSDAGVTFRSHIDGSEHELTPERSTKIQDDLDATITMVLDECTPWPVDEAAAAESMRLSMRWAGRSRAAFRARPGYGQFGIVQGSVFADLRAESAAALTGIGFEGYAVGGLAVGEGRQAMFDTLDLTTPDLPPGRPRYLMGVGRPADIVGAVARGHRHVRLRPADPVRAHRQGLRARGRAQYPQRPPCRSGPAARSRLRLPGLPPLQPRLPAPPVQGRRDAGADPAHLAQSAIFPGPDAGHSDSGRNRRVRGIQAGIRRGRGGLRSPGGLSDRRRRLSRTVMSAPTETHTLTQLGQQTGIPASPEEAVLETVANPHPGKTYLVRFVCPEFTSLCPLTGQPDFGHLVIDYVPDGTIVESKSLKLFLTAFRNHGAFHEACTVRIAERLVGALSGQMAAHRRLLVSARRHADRRVLADRRAAVGPVAAGPGRRALSRARLTRTGTDIAMDAAEDIRAEAARAGFDAVRFTPARLPASAGDGSRRLPVARLCRRHGLVGDDPDAPPLAGADVAGREERHRAGRELRAGGRSADDPAPARPGRDFRLCAERRLSRRHQETPKGTGALDRRPVRVGSQGFRRYRAADGKAAGGAGRARLAGQAHQPGLARVRQLAVPRGDPDHPRPAGRPPEADHCGSCRACLDICPTGAFPAPGEIDARRCISYLTIEHKGPIPRELRPLMGNRIYGCDDCLAVCPWNKFARRTEEPAFLPRAELAAPRLAELAALDDAGFRAVFRKSAVKRIGRDRFVRNVLIAIGNSGEKDLAGSAEALLGDGSALVRGAAVWALRRLDPARAETLRAAAEPAETDPDVQAEWAPPSAGSGQALDTALRAYSG